MHPAQNLVKFNMVPIKGAGLDVLPDAPFIAGFHREDLDLTAIKTMVTRAEVKRARAAAAAAGGVRSGDGTGGDEFVMPAALKVRAGTCTLTRDELYLSPLTLNPNSQPATPEP
jgi:hypothetical protein